MGPPCLIKTPLLLIKVAHTQTSANRVNEQLHVRFVDIENNPFMRLSFAAQPRPYNENLVDASLNAGLVAALIILSAIFVYLYYLTIRPISQIQHVLSQAIEDGDYSLRTEVKEDNEIGELAFQLDRLFAMVSS